MAETSCYHIAHKNVVCRTCFLQVENHVRCFQDEEDALALSHYCAFVSKVRASQRDLVEISYWMHMEKLEIQLAHGIPTDQDACDKIEGSWEQNYKRCASWVQSVRSSQREEEGPMPAFAAKGSQEWEDVDEYRRTNDPRKYPERGPAERPRQQFNRFPPKRDLSTNYYSALEALTEQEAEDEDRSAKVPRTHRYPERGPAERSRQQYNFPPKRDTSANPFSTLEDLTESM